MGNSGTGSTETSTHGVAGPAAVAHAMRVLDRHTRTIVKLALAQHALRGTDTASGVAQWHDRISRHLHQLSLEHGTDAMSTAAEYAAAALEAGTLYPGEELDTFLGEVTLAVRTTSRDIAKGSSFG